MENSSVLSISLERIICIESALSGRRTRLTRPAKNTGWSVFSVREKLKVGTVCGSGRVNCFYTKIAALVVLSFSTILI